MAMELRFLHALERPRANSNTGFNAVWSASTSAFRPRWPGFLSTGGMNHSSATSTCKARKACNSSRSRRSPPLAGSVSGREIFGTVRLGHEIGLPTVDLTLLSSRSADIPVRSNFRTRGRPIFPGTPGRRTLLRTGMSDRNVRAPACLRQLSISGGGLGENYGFSCAYREPASCQHNWAIFLALRSDFHLVPANR